MLAAIVACSIATPIWVRPGTMSRPRIGASRWCAGDRGPSTCRPHRARLRGRLRARSEPATECRVDAIETHDPAALREPGPTPSASGSNSAAGSSTSSTPVDRSVPRSSSSSSKGRRRPSTVRSAVLSLHFTSHRLTTPPQAPKRDRHSYQPARARMPCPRSTPCACIPSAWVGVNSSHEPTGRRVPARRKSGAGPASSQDALATDRARASSSWTVEATSSWAAAPFRSPGG